MIPRFGSRRSAPDLSGEELRLVWGACARLLDYPTPALLDDLDRIEAALGGAPRACREPLLALTSQLRVVPLRDSQEDYVATFDHSRRAALHLTYVAYGDTRRRGVALVQFKQAYRRHGVEFDEGLADGELPDHLCAVLQFGSQVSIEGAWRLLQDHRAGVEMMRLALAEAGSPWRHAAVALCATLPPLRGEEHEAVRRLLADGPPVEEVGLQPALLDPRIPVGPPVPDPLTGAAR